MTSSLLKAQQGHLQVQDGSSDLNGLEGPPEVPLPAAPLGTGPWGYSLVWGVKGGCRVAPWDAAGGGGGMLGGVAWGCVFTSAGEPGIAEAFSFLSAVGVTATGVGERRERQREREHG